MSSTARERAREAANALDDELFDANDWDGGSGAAPEQLADVASDVWEPLLRDVVAELERTMSHLPQMHSAVLRRVKEALG